MGSKQEGERRAWVRFVANGEAAADEDLREAVGILRENGYRVEVRPTWESGDGERLAAEAAEIGVDAVVACGGDGTLHEVLNGLMGAETAPMMAGLPYGTGNDFLSALGIEAGAGQFLRWLGEGPRKIDVGRLNGRYFLNMITAGVGAEVTAGASSEMKGAVGSLAYFLRALPVALERETYGLTLRAGDQEWEGETAFLFVGNGPQAGGGWRLCPAAKLDDGLLDLVLVPEMPVGEMVRCVRELVKVGQPGEYGEIRYWQVKEAEILFDEDVPVNLDGEPASERELKVSVVPGALPFLVP